MKIYLKRNSEYCPIIFNLPEFANKNLVELEMNGGKSERRVADNVIDMNLCINHTDTSIGDYIYARGSYFNYNYGIMTSGTSPKIIIVEKNNSKYAIVSSLFNYNNAQKQRIIKSLKSIGIPKLNIITMNPSSIISDFCDPLVPSMVDMTNEKMDEVLNKLKLELNEAM